MGEHPIKWTGSKPNISHFREFGCKLFCLNTEPGKGKYDPCGKLAVFLGYSKSSKDYRNWLTEERKIISSRNVTFMKFLTCTSTILEDFVSEDLYRSEKTIESLPEKRMVEVELTPLKAYESENESDNVVKCKQDLGNVHQHQPRRGLGRPRIIRTGQKGRPRLQYRPIREETENEEPLFADLTKISLKHAMSSENAEEWP